MIKAWRLNLYFTRLFARYFVYIFSLITLATFLVSLIDAYDSHAHSVSQGRTLVLLAMYRTPDILQTIMPLILLISATRYFVHLGRSQQLLMAQQAGLSLRSLMILPTLSAALIGLLSVTLLNPLAASLLEKHEQFENRQRQNATSLLSVADTGIWLRQVFEDTSLIIHALNWQHQSQRFVNVSIWQYHQNDFLQRIEAGTAEVNGSEWTLHQVIRYSPIAGSRKLDTLQLQTHIDQEKINDSFTSASTVSVWQLAEFIDIIENAGLSAKLHIVHFHQLLAQPIAIVAMFILAAGICFRIHYRQSATGLVLVTLGIGIGYFIFANTFQSLGVFHHWPVLFSIWLPASLFLVSVFLYTTIQESARE